MEAINPPPLLSVIVVAYKSRDEIGACLASLPRRLEGREVEIIVVDNFPADGTSAFIREHFSHVIAMEPGENLGFGRANNLGFARSSGECVLFLNPDTVCNEEALAHCVRRVRAEPAIGLISPKLIQADGSMDLACRRSLPTAWDGFCRGTGLAARFPRVSWFAGYNLTHRPENGTYAVGAINGAFMLGRREVFEAVASRCAAEMEKGEGRAADLEKGERRKEKEIGIGSPLRHEGHKGGQGGAGSDTAALPVEAGRKAYPLNFNSELKPAEGDLPATPDAAPYSLNFNSELKLASGVAAGEPLLATSAPVFDPTFFMYGDDLDLCIRVARAGYRIVYDGRYSITHLKGQSVSKDYDRMSVAIFDANRDVYLKHFGRSSFARAKWRLLFGVWKLLALWRARRRGHKQVKPV